MPQRSEGQLVWWVLRGDLEDDRCRFSSWVIIVYFRCVYCVFQQPRASTVGRNRQTRQNRGCIAGVVIMRVEGRETHGMDGWILFRPEALSHL